MARFFGDCVDVVGLGKNQQWLGFLEIMSAWLSFHAIKE